MKTLLTIALVATLGATKPEPKPVANGPTIDDLRTAAGGLVLKCSTYARDQGLTQEQGHAVCLRLILQAYAGPEEPLN